MNEEAKILFDKISALQEKFKTAREENISALQLEYRAATDAYRRLDIRPTVPSPRFQHKAEPRIYKYRVLAPLHIEIID